MSTVTEINNKKAKNVSAKGALEKYAEMREFEQAKSAESKEINDRIGSLRKTIDEDAAEAAAGQQNLTKTDYSKTLEKYAEMRDLERERASMQSKYNELISEIKKELDEVAHVKTDDRQGELPVDDE